MRSRGQFFAVFFAVCFVAGLVLGGPLVNNAVAAGEPIKIGFGMALSGPLAPAGKAGLLSLQICAEDFNKKGGVLGRPIELVYYDDHSRAADEPAIYTKLITVDKVDFVVSPYGTGLMAAVMPIIMQRNMVFPAFFGLDANKSFKYKYFFMMTPNGPDPYADYTKGFFEVPAALKPRPKTVALVGDDNEYGNNAIDGAEKNAKRTGYKVVYKKAYPPGTVDFTPIVRAIKAAKPDGVFFGSYPATGVGLLKAAKEVNLRPKFMGGGMVGMQYTSLQMNLGPLLNGVMNYTYWVPEPTVKFPGIEAFLSKYQAQAAKEGLDPLGYYVPPLAYSMLEMLLDAIEATKSMDQATVGEYLRTYGFDTVVGKGKFNPENGEWWQSRAFMIQFQNIKSHDISEFSQAGKMVVLYPTEYKSGDIMYPLPPWQ
jgi:branched-chain amino acid transport system substrate-binding protein